MDGESALSGGCRQDGQEPTRTRRYHPLAWMSDYCRFAPEANANTQPPDTERVPLVLPNKECPMLRRTLLAVAIVASFAVSVQAGGLSGCCEPAACVAPACEPSCCEPCCRPSLLDRLHGRLACLKADLCQPVCCEPACAPAACEPACAPAACAPACAPAVCEPACEPACDPCCRPGLLSRLKARLSCCAPACEPVCAPACEPVCEPVCDPCCRPGLFSRLKGRLACLRPNTCCEPCAPACDAGCADCGVEMAAPAPAEAPAAPVQAAPAP